MDAIARFVEYAAAFEDALESDDWSRLEPFFTEDAVYEVRGGPPFGGRHVGRDRVLAGMRESVDGFDRRFASRKVEVLEGPELRQHAVWLRWRASYTGPGLPELVIDGEETARFEGERIRELTDVVALEMSALLEHWFAQYGDRLGAPA